MAIMIISPGVGAVFTPSASFTSVDPCRTGAVNYVSKTDSANLTFLNSAGNAIVKLDNTTNVPYPDKRNSVS